MDRLRTYEGVKQLARDRRAAHGITTATLNLRAIQRVMRAEGISLFPWRRQLRRVKAAYQVIDGQPCVMYDVRLPDEPKLFCLAHELKHHLVDSEEAVARALSCDTEAASNVDVREIAAEVFAAEFILPEEEFIPWARDFLGDIPCTLEQLVYLKQRRLVKISYAFLSKRLERLGFADPGTLPLTGIKALERRLLGEPWYLTRARTGFVTR